MGIVLLLRWLELSIAAGAVWALWSRMQFRVAQTRRERREEEESRAYARLNVELPANGGMHGLAARVTRVVAEKSSFRRVAMLVRDADGKLVVASSVGMDEDAVRLINAWAQCVPNSGRDGGLGGRRAADGLGRRAGLNSFAVVLGKAPADFAIRRAVVIPMWTTGRRMLGALVVGADGLLSASQRDLEQALSPLEALSLKVARSIENVALSERLLQAERLAGMGILAGDMVHALGNPLTAVLGFAELIAGSTNEARVKKDAGIIVQEALRMRRTVETLLGFGQPMGRGDCAVNLRELMDELAAECARKLEVRGVRLVAQADGEVPLVSGNRHRLRQLLEHLLNNAAQALSETRHVKSGEESLIRMSVSCSGRPSEEERGLKVHLIVSDTGPGFREPGQMFDPFSIIGAGVERAGMGLSVCYGIVREHGGEISAFNMHPRGAAIAVELPVAKTSGKKPRALEDVASSASA